MAVVRWSDEATDRLTDIIEFLEGIDPRAAQVFVQRVRQAVEQLELFPYSGQALTGFGFDSMRELVIGNFRLAYVVFSSDEVNVVSIRGGPRPSG
ncbi:MAG: type II toxin-antitoxin system RelE/ParE family toxin [Dehalococcoidia bacterium]